MNQQLQQKINDNKDKVESWLNDQRTILKKQNYPLPIYSSFDLRDSGFKIGIVDSNLFPAGFNNLGEIAKEKAVIAFKDYIPKTFKKILIIPEAHTRNQYYISNLCAIRGLLTKAGFEVILGSVRDDIVGEKVCTDSANHDVVLEKMEKKENKVITKSFDDGLIILNNDFSVQNPDLLNNINQEVLPPLALGWTHRKKSTHFCHFNKLLDDFADTLEIDPWLLKTIFTQVDNIHFRDTEDLKKVAKAVDETIEKIKEKYVEYKVTATPTVFVKDNSGTYGMGIITAKSGEDILNLNTKKKGKMLFGKQKSIINSVIIQEGIPTTLEVDGQSAEPVIYSAGGKIIGGFMRVHPEKSDNLNSPGMKFDLLLENKMTKPLLDVCPKELSIYGILADIANLAIAKEHGAVQ
jgi:glutamate--cysteine ligase